MKKLQINAALQIQKPVQEVYDAIVDPSKMSVYFISKSTAPMEEGKTVWWEFPEFEGSSPVRVGKMKPNELIVFSWDIGDKAMTVEINLILQKDGSTLVKVTEGEMENDETGLNWLKGNTEGWANFLACLKAYLEYGINLRKGAFDFMRKN
ncbi:SRPBCC domain-containing protein [Aquiflexum sp.]|uniref:SRPBCC domain-containing protein n=1 Tax=Aquiflexum sp. TaxID=1872584 RepID=UPI003594291C